MAIVVAAMLLGSQAGIAAAVCLALALVDYTFSFLREGWQLEVFTSPPSWVTTALTAYCAMCAVTAPDAVAPALVAVLQVTLSKMVAECSLCMRAVGQSPFRSYSKAMVKHLVSTKVGKWRDVRGTMKYKEWWKEQTSRLTCTR